VSGALSSRRATLSAAALPLALVAAVVAFGANSAPSMQATVTLGLCNLIIVCGLQVFIGNSGVYSFGQLGFAMVGAYVAALITIPPTLTALQTPGLPDFLAEIQMAPLPATLVAALACVILALAVGLPLMRTSTLAIPISTFAFLLVSYNVVANWDSVTDGSAGLLGIQTSSSVESVGLWAAVSVAVALVYKRSASGYRLQATREDEAAARSLGIGVTRERMVAFAISAALCGVGGALAVQQSGVLTPNSFYFGATVTTVTMLVVGGSRSVFGATLGTLGLTVVTEVLRTLEEGRSVLGFSPIGETPGLAAIGLGLILLATMIALPDGLSGGLEAPELVLGRRVGAAAIAASFPPAAVPLPSANASAVNRRRQSGELRAEGITLAFGGLRVLQGIDLCLRRGELLGLIGPNGAGKTTLVNVISGFQPADAGSVWLDGEKVSGRSPQELARVGLTRSFQAALPFRELSCLESVAVGAMGVGLGKRRAAVEAHALLGQLGLSGRARQRAGSLAAGEQRLLGIARALATRPRYLLLDEPAAGLNEAESMELVRILRGVLADFGCGLLLIEHDMGVVMELCARVHVLDQGETVAIGSPQQVQSDPAVVESYLGRSFVEAADA
jgi:branched-chain amino acid transport system permease protein